MFLVDNRPSHASGGLQSQRGVHTNPATGRAPHRRANAVQVRREALPRPFLRQQAQLVGFLTELNHIVNNSSTVCFVLFLTVRHPGKGSLHNFHLSLQHQDMVLKQGLGN